MELPHFSTRSRVKIRASALKLPTRWPKWFGLDELAIGGGGPKAKEFEREFAAYVGKNHASFHSSGSSALITAVFATDASKHRPVVIGSSGFVVAINAVYRNQARPIFLRTDPETLQASSVGFEPIVEQPAALLVTHFLGNLVDTPNLAAAVGADLVIEDAGQAYGARLDGRPAGSFEDIGTFAASHKKLVTAGQGGANVTNSDQLITRMRTVGHHGKGSRRFRVRMGVSNIPSMRLRPRCWTYSPRLNIVT